MERRTFIRVTGLGLTGLALGCEDAVEPGACEPSLDQTEGPFHLPGVPVRTELDLWGDQGRPTTFEGRVLDTDCAPVAGAVVELWHADPSGLYDDSEDLRYRGETTTDAEGHFAFHTLRPGQYENTPTWTRPAHFHVKVHVGGEERLTTQLYFPDDELNEPDAIFDPSLLMTLADDGEGGDLVTHDLVV